MASKKQQKRQNAHTNLTLKCLRIQCQDYAKCNTETNTMAARGRETYACATKPPELGIFQTGKQRNRKTGLEIL